MAKCTGPVMVRSARIANSLAGSQKADILPRWGGLIQFANKFHLFHGVESILVFNCRGTVSHIMLHCLRDHEDNHVDPVSGVEAILESPT